MAAQGVQGAGAPFARYAMNGRGFDVEAGSPTRVPVAPTGRVEAGELPGGPAIVVRHRGVDVDVASAVNGGREWLAANRWTAAGAPWRSTSTARRSPSPGPSSACPAGPRDARL